jgi:hypothetical protein
MARRRSRSAHPSPPEEPVDGLSARLSGWLAWLLAAATALVFLPAVRFDFVHWDDHTYVYGNPYLNPPSLQGIAHLWTSGYRGIYAPLTFSVHGLHALLLGFNGPRFHVVSLLVHVANVILVYVVVRQLLAQRKVAAPAWPAACGALLFAVHPLRAEPVGWVTGMKELLSTFFALLAMRSYFGAPADRSGPAGLLPGGTGWFVLAMLAKPTIAVLGPVVAVLDVTVRRTEWRAALRGIWVWVAVAVPFALFAKHLQPDTMLTSTAPLWLRPFVAADAIRFYAVKIVAPLGLTPDYGRTPEWLLDGGAWRDAWIVPALLVAGAGLAAWRRHFAPLGLLTAFVLALAPLLGIVPFLTQNLSTVADHYLYFPFFMVCLGVGLLVGALPARRQWAGVAVALVAAAFLSLLTVRQLAIWRNDAALFPYAIARNPSSATLRMNYAQALYEKGQYEESLVQLREAARITPHADIYNNLGSVLVELGRFEEARAEFEHALSLNPSDREIAANLARLDALMQR